MPTLGDYRLMRLHGRTLMHQAAPTACLPQPGRHPRPEHLMKAQARPFAKSEDILLRFCLSTSTPSFRFYPFNTRDIERQPCESLRQRGCSMRLNVSALRVAEELEQIFAVTRERAGRLPNKRYRKVHIAIPLTRRDHRLTYRPW